MESKIRSGFQEDIGMPTEEERVSTGIRGTILFKIGNGARSTREPKVPSLHELQALEEIFKRGTIYE